MHLALFVYGSPITSKQVNSDIFSCLGGREVTLQKGVREFPGSISGSGKDFIVVVVVLFLVQKVLFT